MGEHRKLQSGVMIAVYAMSRALPEGGRANGARREVPPAAASDCMLLRGGRSLGLVGELSLEGDATFPLSQASFMSDTAKWGSPVTKRARRSR
jgi:hypothetical protein